MHATILGPYNTVQLKYDTLFRQPTFHNISMYIVQAKWVKATFCCLSRYTASMMITYSHPNFLIILNNVENC